MPTPWVAGDMTGEGQPTRPARPENTGRCIIGHPVPKTLVIRPGRATIGSFTYEYDDDDETKWFGSGDGDSADYRPIGR
jgi:hypothetical protein